MLYNPQLSLASQFSRREIEPAKADVLINDGDIIKLPFADIKVLHSRGIRAEAFAMLPETLYFRAILFLIPLLAELIFLEEIMILWYHPFAISFFALEGDYTIYPGHDGSTTLAHEKAENPFLGFGWDKK